MNEHEEIETRIDSECSATIPLDPRIYSRDAILRAAYWLTNVAFIQILPSVSGHRIVVRLTLKEPRATLESPVPATIGVIVGDFCNSVLEFELRRQVETETSAIRQLILAKAFSEAGVLEDEPPGPISDPVEAKSPGSFSQIVTQS